MLDPILEALADTQHRLKLALSEVESERRQRHHVEQLLDGAHEMLAQQHQLIELLGSRPAGRVAA